MHVRHQPHRGRGTGLQPRPRLVHAGHELSFVLDIADLYKTEIGIPVAFDVAAEGDEDIGSRTRRALRDRINETRLLDRCVRDITHLLMPDGSEKSATAEDDVVTLQTDGNQHVPSGRNHSDGSMW